MKYYAKYKNGWQNVEKVNALLVFKFRFSKSNAMHPLHVILKMHHILSGSKIDAMHGFHMILEMLQVFENESFRPANRMAAGEPLQCWDILQVTINMVHHLMRSGVSPRPVLISVSIISDVDDTLGLLTDEGEGAFKRLLLW